MNDLPPRDPQPGPGPVPETPLDAGSPTRDLAGAEQGPGAPQTPATDGRLRPADNNIVHTRATLTYRIQDPIRYVFSFVSASNAIQNTLDNALLYTAAHFTVDDII